MTRKTRAAAENVNPVGRPEEPGPWYLQDPWEALDPWAEFEEPELPGIPMTIGPASRSSAPVPNPMTVEPPGIDANISLAAELNWRLPRNPK